MFEELFKLIEDASKCPDCKTSMVAYVKDGEGWSIVCQHCKWTLRGPSKHHLAEALILVNGYRFEKGDEA